MRNLKKVLSLVLCLAMMLSIMVVGAGAAFTDQNQFDGRYAEASEVLTNLGVLKGYEDGSFQPKGDITRAEVAAMIYRIVTGDVTDAKVSGYAADNQFKDVKSDDWFAGYVNYCANVGYIKGYGDGNFGPQDKVTGYQALAMILRAMGYDQNGEFTGPQWALNTAATAESRGILQNVLGEELNGAAVRELVAELIFQAMIIPTVVYTPAMSYSLYQNSVLQGKLNATLGEKAFGLQKTSGEICAVGRTAGTTQLITDTKVDTVEGTDTPWTDIGYAAYVWTVATSGAKTRTAVSDLVVTGESLGVSTDRTSYSALTTKTNANFLAGLDSVEGYNLYYNGVLAASYNGKTWTVVNAAANTAFNAAITGLRGVKIDFVDNDGQGLAEAVVVTEYTTGWVSAITTADSTTGTQGVKETTTYLGNGNAAIAVGASKLVTDDTLAVGDCVTYVEYAGDYYVDLAAATAAKFSARNVSAGAETTYTIGGSNYYISDLEYVTDHIRDNGVASDYLNNRANENLSKNVVIYTDAYGYIIYAEAEVVPDSYLYVISNNETVANTGRTAAVVAFTDGTIDTIQVKNGTVTNSNTSYTYTANQLAAKMYTYTVNSDGSYNLGKVQNELVNGTYTKGTATFNGTTVVGTVNAPVAVDTASVVVDLRDYEVGDTTADVFTGYGEIPTVQKAVLWYAAKENALNTGNTITYSFLLDNQNDVLKDFIVYQTTDYTQVLDKADQTITSYKMDVVIDGAVVEDYVLTPAQFAKVQTYGVGLYSFKNDDLTEYSAFNEVDGNVASWSQGRISVKYNNSSFGGSDALVNYTYASDSQISVLKIGSGVTGFNLVYGGNYNVYVVPNADGTSAKHIYVIVDTDDVTAEATQTLIKGDYKYTYNVSKTTAADDLTVCVGRENIVDIHPTAIPGAAIGDITGVADGKTVTINLTYQQYLQAVKDGKVTVTIAPAAGNKIAVATASEYSIVPVNYQLAIGAGESKEINLKSIGNKPGEVVDTYIVKVVVGAASDNANIKIDPFYDTDSVRKWTGDDGVMTFNILNTALTGSVNIGLKQFVEQYVDTIDANATKDITVQSPTVVNLVVTAEDGVTQLNVNFKVVDVLPVIVPEE